MEVSLNFNYPPREDKVTVTFGDPNANDLGCDFRIGLIKADEPGNGVHWSLLEWIKGSDPGTLAELELVASRGDIVKVEKRSKDGAVTYMDIDTADNWPADALGNDSVVAGWSFEE